MAGTVRVDPEFQGLIPPLTEQERAQLEANLLRDGCRDPLVTWRGLLLDGHNRLAICKEHGLKFSTAEIAVKTRDEAKAWVICNQFGRRNLSNYQRAELALALEPLIAARAKERQGTRTDLVQNSAPSEPSRNRFDSGTSREGWQPDRLWSSRFFGDGAREHAGVLRKTQRVLD